MSNRVAEARLSIAAAGIAMYVRGEDRKGTVGLVLVGTFAVTSTIAEMWTSVIDLAE